MLVDPALSGLPPFLTPRPGLNSGFMIPQVTAAALVSGKQAARLSGQRRFDPHLGQPGRPRLDGRPWRAPPAATWPKTPLPFWGIELLAAAQGIDFHAPLASSTPLEAARATCVRRCPTLEDDRHFHPDMEAATNLVPVARWRRACGGRHRAGHE
jgi:histidine ammonia-lyase